MPAFASLDEALRDFFVVTLIHHLGAAIAGETPSPKRPLVAGKSGSAWARWRVRLATALHEPPWDGHHYVLELTRDPITRGVRKAVGAAVERIEASLASLSRVERVEILRRALHGA